MNPVNENLLFYGNSTITNIIFDSVAQKYNRAVRIGRKVPINFQRGQEFLKISDLKQLDQVEKVKSTLIDSIFFDVPVHIFLGAFENPESGLIHEIKFDLFADKIISNLRIMHNLIHIFSKNLKPNSTLITFSGGGLGGDTKMRNADSYLLTKAINNEIVEICSNNDIFSVENIRFFSISPGFFVSPLQKSFLNNEVILNHEEPIENEGKLITLVEFLLKKESTGLSGSILSSRYDSIDFLYSLSKKILQSLNNKKHLGLMMRRRKTVI